MGSVLLSAREYFHRGGLGDIYKLSRMEPYTIARIDMDGIDIDYATLAPGINKKVLVFARGDGFHGRREESD